MIVIEHIAVKRRLDVTLTNTNIITYTAVSLFLPYILTTIVLTFLLIYILTNRNTRTILQVQRWDPILKFIFVYILTIPVLSRNWLGLIVGAGMIFAVTLGIFIRNVMDDAFFERILTLICALSLTSAGYAITERIVNLIFDGRHSHRIAAVFSHPNYFGAMVGTVIIICAYKILTNQEHQWFYYVAVGMNVISMYLCKSMFVWVEVFIGITVLLVIMMKYRLLAIWLGTAVIGVFLIFVLDLPIIPRLSDLTVTVGIRREIWRLAALQIKNSPLFGHGFMTFSFVYDQSYRGNMIPHSHNIYIDMLLNFGIVGSIAFVWFSFKHFKGILKACIVDRKIKINSLVIAVSVATLVHGVTDLTILWIQTFPLYLIILSGLGVKKKFVD